MPTPRLWTPIANAWEAYRRRIIIEPEAAYEHIWRLIHIQEALAVTLASLMATRVAYLAASDDEISPLQEALTGLRQESAGSNHDDVEPSPFDDDVETSPWG